MPILAVLVFLVSCGDDAAPARDASAPCASNADCDDAIYCNGVERCDPGVAGADARGCLAQSGPPCMASQTCDEAGESCRAMCDVSDDADEDGSRAIDCGGTDCDDADANRFPGNPEVCDVDDRDEDCDPRTFGVRDADGDGAPDALCCNDESARVCGTDCDDTQAGRNPSVPEVCGDVVDNDCDTIVDEGATIVCYLDADRDTFAPAGAPTMPACSCPAGYTDTAPAAGTTDCNDDAAGGETFHPGAPELCDGLDNDCSIAADRVESETVEDADGDEHSALDAPCTGGSFPRDDCKDDSARVTPGQTRFFSDPYCEPAGCDPFRIAGRGWVCGCEGFIPTYDYDCDGVGSPEPAHALCRGALGSACDSAIDGSCTGSGPVTAAAPSQCGLNVSYVQCSCNPSGGSERCEAAPAASRALPCH
jgi:hypothetical protein